jgi:hypothetical protein
MQREGPAFVAGCFQGTPGMFVFGGRATAYVYLNEYSFKYVYNI